jgi:hypothetical protein
MRARHCVGRVPSTSAPFSPLPKKQAQSWLEGKRVKPKASVSAVASPRTPSTAEKQAAPAPQPGTQPGTEPRARAPAALLAGLRGLALPPWALGVALVLLVQLVILWRGPGARAPVTAGAGTSELAGAVRGLVLELAQLRQQLAQAQLDSRLH